MTGFEVAVLFVFTVVFFLFAVLWATLTDVGDIIRNPGVKAALEGLTVFSALACLVSFMACFGGLIVWLIG